MAYARDTSVTVERSRAEIESLLMKARASKFASGWGDDNAYIVFELGSRLYRFELPLPDRAASEFTLTGARNLHRSPKDAHKRWEQACRSRWRALLLVIKAKLEAVEAGISTFEEEFLAHIVVPGKGPLGKLLIPQLDEVYSKRKSPLLLEM